MLPSSKSSAVALSILQDWCRWMGVNAQRSVLILGIPDDCEEEEFQEALQAALRPLGRYRVICKVFRRELGAKVALVEFADNVDQRLIPQEIQNNRGPWTVMFLPQVPNVDLQDTPDSPEQPQEQASAAEEGGAAGKGGEEDKEGRAAAEGETSGEEGAVGGEVFSGQEGVLDEENSLDESGSSGSASDDDSETDAESLPDDESGGEPVLDQGTVAIKGAITLPGVKDEVGTLEEKGAAGDMGAAGVMGAEGRPGPSGEARGACEEVTFDEAVGAGAGGQQWCYTLQPILENMPYQELRPFTGMEDPSPGGQFFESWIDHANDMLYLWRHISEGERRRRLMESLGGPALDVLCGLLEEHPDTPAQDCLATLVQVFGNNVTGMTARLNFVTCSQRPQESLSAYVMRLEGLLQMAVDKGAIQPSMMDQMRAQQVLRRSQPNQMLENNLREMSLEGRPPDFVRLLRLIRETEAWAATVAEREQLQVEEGLAARPAMAQAAPVCGEAAAAAAPKAAPDPDGATKAGPGDAKPSSATEEDENASAPAGSGQVGPTEGPGEPESFAHAGEQEVAGLKEEESGNEDEAGEASHLKSSLEK
uniref:paraneoplastic antigen Ma6E n=1 Tax=Jaculus jaculus TaxID=51337 RepID=UPI001E1B0FF8|nr:paraneoplastic antigen Ma6E [Jaculus jaculus]